MTTSLILFLVPQDMDRLGVSNALGEALSRIDPEGKRPIHLRFYSASL